MVANPIQEEPELEFLCEAGARYAQRVFVPLAFDPANSDKIKRKWR
jgi:hypothetical protein